MDPLDSQYQADQAWVQFRVGFSAAAALRALVKELSEVAPGYLADLRIRIGDAVSQGELWAVDYPFEDWDGFVPIQAPIGRLGATFVPWDVAAEMELHLFPDGASDHDQLWLFRGSIPLLLHATLESFASAHGFSGGRLTDFFLSRLPGIPAALDRPLNELDATRNLFAHSGGVVDEQYRTRSIREQIVVGERRPVTDHNLDEFFRAAWQTVKLRHVSQRSLGQ